ncbi:nicotinate (nicotinamide) nucleotide adenylyltransferase [Variovorax sp. OV329]|uniref:nicotinate (nicotinamide) nucleotide adenylyltransferase n=1 Tax=Variovorax sp. OV329 TaxID=1882825 RepID=UPI0008ED5939|nr:nicotinate (nicotinamide) nucleotide adenylyltransferase [Variovorax sp. OV329]SFM43020.1 nicotinate-nucleotide adenylyltransferase [Variovorax sp. OV329]
MALSTGSEATARRIGVFGGAFDPPHNAHLALARCALQQLALDELRVIPTGQAWHKARVLSPAEHRLAMARLAFGELPGVVVDEREIRRSGPSYTLDTLRELRQEHPGAQLLLILGADQGAALPSWHGWQEILEMAVVALAQRPDPDRPDAGFDPATLPDLPAGARFARIELPAMDLSATEIRLQAGHGKDVSLLVPPAVARYIDLHHLYRSP